MCMTYAAFSYVLVNYFIWQSNACRILLAHTSIRSRQASQQVHAGDMLDKTKELQK